MTGHREKYGLLWPETTDDAQIECAMIRKGGKWEENGRTWGNGEYFHYYRLFRLFWPQEDEHRWEQESLRAILSNQFTSLMGCTGSAKTSTAAKFALCFYATWPKGTTILISSTDMRGLEMRVFGRIKELISNAKARYEWFPGNVIDSKKVVATDNIDDGDIRNLRDSITCIPCMSSSGSFVGLGKYIGIHNARVMLIGDEFQLMHNSILESIPNLLNNPYAKFIFLGNPLAQNDPLDKVSEPKEGWSSVGIPKKTTLWRTKFMDGVCLNLPGLDSPNWDYPADQPDRFKYMVGRAKEKLVRESYGEGSVQYASQILGVRVQGLTARKVITKEVCEKFNAFRKPVWFNDDIKRIYSIDAAYGSVGGDLCMGGHVEFGTEMEDGKAGKSIINIAEQKIIPVDPTSGAPPDDQIALFVRQECERLDIPPECVYFDGRTLLMSAFARLWSPKCNPVDFGGRTTNRPVSLDMHVLDEETGVKRLKLCNEHYSKFVTELWFSLRYAIESGQICGMTEEILNDATPREWKIVRSNLIEIESKSDTRKRTGVSPDRTDQVVTAIEGCRRMGFQISKLSQTVKTKPTVSWLEKHLAEQAKMESEKELQTV